MTRDAGAMAALHADVLPASEAWSATFLSGILASPGSFDIHDREGFAIGRVAADEAELYTLAVAAPARRTGIATRLLCAFDAEARARGATNAWLEVAADNAAAIALYLRAGWTATGRRRGYYRGTDALILHKPLSDGVSGAAAEPDSG